MSILHNGEGRNLPGVLDRSVTTIHCSLYISKLELSESMMLTVEQTCIQRETSGNKGDQ